MGFKKVKEIREKLPRSTKIIISHLSEVTEEMREEKGIIPAEDPETHMI